MPIDSDKTLPFLCVCGESIDASTQSGGQCSTCGRSYSGQAVDLSMTMSMSLSMNDQAAVVDNDEMVGKSLDHFTILEPIRAGGMGTVYRAMDESLQRYVAIKVLKPSRNSSGTVERLLQEARAQARVNHPNVVHIYYVSRDEQLPFLAMELVPGESLADRLRSQPLTFDEVTRIGVQVAQALAASAQYDIVHGDIKPANILLYGEVAKLSDFGLAQRISGGQSSAASISGTPNYMSPEACRGEATTQQSDMYSLGMMLFEMTFGSLPYSTDQADLSAVLNAHQHAEPEFPASWPAQFPVAWRSFLERLLAKDPAQRYATWDELIHDLSSLQPLKTVPAGRLQRGIAWVLDLTLQTMAVVILGAGLTSLAEVIAANVYLLKVAAVASMLVVPAGVMWWISRGGLTPGKKLMQLRVVDRHGLRLEPTTLAQRSLVQYMPIWGMPLGFRTGSVGVSETIWVPVWIAMSVFLLVDLFVAIIRREGRSLHDEMFGTRVVLADSRAAK